MGSDESALAAIDHPIMAETQTADAQRFETFMATSLFSGIAPLRRHLFSAQPRRRL